MRTPALVHSPRGLIPRLQRRYARVLAWSLAHRGWSVCAIVLISALSVIPMMQTKKDMFGGDGGEQVFIGYQWKGAYTREQMAEEVTRLERFIDARRAQYHVTQVYSWFSEEEGSSTTLTVDLKQVRDLPALDGTHPQGTAALGAGGFPRRQQQRWRWRQRRRADRAGATGRRFHRGAARARRRRGAGAGAAQGTARRARGQRRP